MANENETPTLEAEVLENPPTEAPAVTEPEPQAEVLAVVEQAPVAADATDLPVVEDEKQKAETAAVKKQQAKEPYFGPQERAMDEVIRISIRQIYTNRQNPRDPIPHLRDQGFCLFMDEKNPNHPNNKLSSWQPSDKQPERKSLWEMFFSGDDNEVAAAVALLDETEPHVVKLADSLANQGQLTPALVMLDGTFPSTKIKRYKVVEGATRVIASLLAWAKYRNCKKGGETLLCQVKKYNATQARMVSFVANQQRREMNPIEILRNIELFRNEHLTDEEIAHQTGMSEEDIKTYSKLALLEPPIQKRLAVGEITLRAALKLADKVSANRLTSEEATEVVTELEEHKQKLTGANLDAAIENKKTTGSAMGNKKGGGGGGGSGVKRRPGKKAIETMLKDRKALWKDQHGQHPPLTSGQLIVLLYLQGDEDPVATVTKIAAEAKAAKEAAAAK